MPSQAQSSVTGTKIIITKLIGYEKDGRLSIEWSTDGSIETNYREVQSTMDGKKFSTFALVLGADPGKSGKEYGFQR